MGIKHYEVNNFTSSTSLSYLTKLAHTLMHERVTEAFAEHDVSFTHWIVLTRVCGSTALTASDLCRAMRHDNGAFTRVLDQLQERGFIKRERSREDRRVIELRLTAAGRKRSIELTALHVALLNGIFANFTEPEFRELTRLLNKLIASLETRPP